MAAPQAAGQALGRLLPPGPVLELCCGLGGLTRGLAETRSVLAVDVSPERLLKARANLETLGLGERGSFLCCDLTRPALAAPPQAGFVACVADPDWSAEGSLPQHWAGSLEDMRPPVRELMVWCRDFSPRLALRLPAAWDCAALAGGGQCQRVEVRQAEHRAFAFLLLGLWPRVEPVWFF